MQEIKDRLVVEFNEYEADPEASSDVYRNLPGSVEQAALLVADLLALDAASSEQARLDIDELVHDCADRSRNPEESILASTINNQGFEAQVAYCIAYCGLQSAIEDIRNRTGLLDAAPKKA
jgi:hypothetical protein